MKALLVLLMLLLLPALAHAQSWGPPPSCPDLNGQHLNWTGTAWLCGTSVRATTGTFTAGPGIAISPTNVVSSIFPVTTLTVARPVLAADGSRTLSYNSAAPGAFALPAAGTVGNGWAVCLYARGTGPITLSVAAGVAVYGGPLVLTQRQFECAQADDAGGWLLSGASAVVPNPNVFQ